MAISIELKIGSDVAQHELVITQAQAIVNLQMSLLEVGALFMQLGQASLAAMTVQKAANLCTVYSIGNPEKQNQGSN